MNNVAPDGTSTTKSPDGAPETVEPPTFEQDSKVGSDGFPQPSRAESSVPLERARTGERAFKTLHGRRNPLFGFEAWASSGELTEISFERKPSTTTPSDDDWIKSVSADSDSEFYSYTDGPTDDEEEQEVFSESESESESLDESSYSGSKEDFTLMSAPSSTGTLSDFDTCVGSKSNAYQFGLPNLPMPSSHNPNLSYPTPPPPSVTPLYNAFGDDDYVKLPYALPAVNLPPNSSNVGAYADALERYHQEMKKFPAYAAAADAQLNTMRLHAHSNLANLPMPSSHDPNMCYPPPPFHSTEGPPSTTPLYNAFGEDDYLKLPYALPAFSLPNLAATTDAFLESYNHGMLTNYPVLPTKACASEETAPIDVHAQLNSMCSHAHAPSVPPGVPQSEKHAEDNGLSEGSTKLDLLVHERLSSIFPILDDTSKPHHAVVNDSAEVPLVEDASDDESEGPPSANRKEFDDRQQALFPSTKNPSEIAKSQGATQQSDTSKHAVRELPGWVEAGTQTEEIGKADERSSSTQTTREMQESDVSGAVDKDEEDTIDWKSEFNAVAKKRRQEAALAASIITRLEAKVSELTLDVKEATEQRKTEEERSASIMTIWRQRRDHYEARVNALEDQNRRMIVQDGRDGLSAQLASSYLVSNLRVDELEAANAALSNRVQQLEHQLACQEGELPHLVAAWDARCQEFEAEADRAWNEESEANECLVECQEEVQRLEQELTRQHNESTAVIERWQASYAALESQMKATPTGCAQAWHEELEAIECLVECQEEVQLLEQQLTRQHDELTAVIEHWQASYAALESQMKATPAESEAIECLVECQEEIQRLHQQLTRQHDESTAVIEHWQASYAALESQMKATPAGYTQMFEQELPNEFGTMIEDGPMREYCNAWLAIDSMPNPDLSEGKTHQVICTVKWLEDGIAYPRNIGTIILDSSFATFADARVAIHNNVIVPQDSKGWNFLLVGPSSMMLPPSQESMVLIHWCFSPDRMGKDGWYNPLSLVLCSKYPGLGGK